MKRRRIAIVALVALAAAGLAAWNLRWGTLKTYVPSGATTLRGAMRTMAEHDAFMSERDWPYILRLSVDGGGELVYFGSRHTDDPDDPQIVAIERVWDELAPTAAVCESRLGFFVGTSRAGVRMFGEPAMAASLARRDGIPLHTLEPSWETEVNAMFAFPPGQVLTFYMLRVYVSERDDVDPGERNALAMHLLSKRSSRPGLGGIFADLDGFDVHWDEHFQDELGDWRLLPPEALWPSRKPGRLHEIATRSNEIRDEHMARVIVDLVTRGERVLAICGGSHVVKQEPVLRESIAGE